MGRFLKGTVAKGSRLITDGGTEFTGEAVAHVRHEPEVTGKEWERARSRMARQNLFVANFKMWMRGTFHQSMHQRLLQLYLNEHCFRHNRRKSKSPLKPLQSLLELACRLRAPTWSQFNNVSYKPT